MDMTGTVEVQSIGANLDDFDAPEICAEAVELAAAAWNDHKQADRLTTDLAPKWPTHRQPPVDRAIMRLAYHEMTSDRTPVKVAINEAVELAKVFGARESAAFVNGVLDKMAKRLGLRKGASNEITKAESGQALRRSDEEVSK